MGKSGISNKLVMGIFKYTVLGLWINCQAKALHNLSTWIYRPVIEDNRVWKAQGTVLSETGNALEAENNVFEPSVIYEGNAQILSGNVFKIWYSKNLVDAPNNIAPSVCYAESVDGKTWTKYASNPVIADHCRGFMFKLEDVYYYYCAHYTELYYDLYTSNDGINFTLDTHETLVIGGAGTWDELNIANMSIIIEGGTWYMFYEAVNAVGAGVYAIGLATSTDGRAWTKYASNPIIYKNSEWNGGADVHKIGSVYYMWLHKSYNVGLPTDMWRYKSTDLYTWTRDGDGPGFPRTTPDEGVGFPEGQVADPSLVEVDNKVYMFYAATHNGYSRGMKQHIKLAIANMPFTDLILTNEGNGRIGLP